MSFRPRLLFTFLAAVLIPLITLALFVRGEMTERLTAQYERSVDALLSVIEQDLSRDGREIAASLAALRKTIVDDNNFRRAAVDRDPEERRYLLDYAGRAMRLAGLSMLQIQDEAGRIISSGHFRNEYDRLEPELPRLLASTPAGIALVQVRAPDAPFLALARVDSFRMANRRFTIIGGKRVEQAFLKGLAREDEMKVSLLYADSIMTSGTERDDEDGSPVPARVDEMNTPTGDRSIARELTFPYIETERNETAFATFRVIHRLDELRALRRSIDRWFAIAVAAAILLSIALVYWFASRISRPLVELAEKTSRIDLEQLNVDFDTSRKDEIGMLSRLLGAMTDRLRTSASRIKDAERRATLGELARQVNHDIKNGLTPIRNVFRHLTGLARDHPDELPAVLRERQGTLEAGITYLENLAGNYARLSPKSERQPCGVNSIIRQVMADRDSGRAEMGMTLCEGAAVLADPLSLRRILENLVDNAVDSIASPPGKVTVSTEIIARDTGEHPVLRITVADTGTGMSEEQRARVFDDFYTTKKNGTGLGLSIVRRLVMDLDGSIRVDSEMGGGSRFIIDLPVASSGKAE